MKKLSILFTIATMLLLTACTTRTEQQPTQCNCECLEIESIQYSDAGIQINYTNGEGYWIEKE